MKPSIQVFKFILPIILLAGCQQTVEGDVIVKNVSIIDVENGQVISSKDVVIDGKKISSIIDHQNGQRYQGEVIDGTDKYLIPGLWDMHSHTWNAKDTRRFVFPLDIAHGVTGIRNMAGDCRGDSQDCADRATFEEIQAMKEDIRKGTLIGPKIHNASTFLDGPHSIKKEALIITSPRQAREVVRSHKEQGFDLLKTYEYLKRDVYLALADEARKQKIDFGGHVPWTISVKEAVEAGHKSIEHAYGLLEAVSGMEHTFIEEKRQALGHDEFTLDDRYELELGPDGHFPRMLNEEGEKFIMVDSLFRELANTLKDHDTWIAPTLTMNALFLEHDEITHHDMMKYIPLLQRMEWDKALNQYRNSDENFREGGRIWFEAFKKLIARLHDAGVGILAGSDCDVKLIVPGYHLHQELEFLVEVGLTPFEALQTATFNAAKYFEREREIGTIEQGKLADLVLLDANPLEDITNTQRISAVVANGRYFDRQALDDLLAEVERAANPQEGHKSKPKE